MLELVVMVTFDVPKLLAIDEGLKLQVAPLGSPGQESVTVPVNPNVGFTVTVEVVEKPAITVAGARAEADIAKFGAVVFKRTTTAGKEDISLKIRSGRPSPFMSAAAAIVVLLIE